MGPLPAWLGTFSDIKQAKWLGTQDLSDEFTWEASIFQTMMARHADLIVPGKYNIEEGDESQSSQPQNDDPQQNAKKAVLRVPQFKPLYKAFQRMSDGQPVVVTVVKL